MTEATARFPDLADLADLADRADRADRAQDWLARYGDPAGVAAARRAWEDRTADSPTAAFFGAFDCGKSSLLHRLLVDDDLAVPDWLTISARHETFAASDIRYRGAVLRDTPGVEEELMLSRQRLLGSIEELVSQQPLANGGDGSDD